MRCLLAPPDCMAHANGAGACCLILLFFLGEIHCATADLLPNLPCDPAAASSAHRWHTGGEAISGALQKVRAVHVHAGAVQAGPEAGGLAVRRLGAGGAILLLRTAAAIAAAGA